MKKLPIAALLLVLSCGSVFAQPEVQATEKVLASLQKQMEEQAKRIRKLEEADSMPGVVSREAGAGVGLIVGQYIWTDPTGARSLRYQGVTKSGDYIRDEKGNEVVSFSGEGPIVVREFQSTAFLVDSRHLVTSGFILSPWQSDPMLDESENPQFMPSIRVLHAYLPGIKHALNVEVTGAAESGDAVLCKLDEEVKNQRGLSLTESSNIEPGEAIVMLGYPGGVELQISRVPDDVRREIYKYGAPGVDETAGFLAERGFIQPIPLQSRISGRTEDRLFFETFGNFGSTGAPLVNARGQVVGMSQSSHSSFPGFNMGITTARLKSWIEGSERFQR